MEINNNPASAELGCVELPPLIKMISSNDVGGFDTVNGNAIVDDAFQSNGLPSPGSSTGEIEKIEVRSLRDVTEPISTQQMDAVSISMPPSPILENVKTVNFSDHLPAMKISEVPISSAVPEAVRTETNEGKSGSRPTQNGSGPAEANIHNSGSISTPRNNNFKDKRYDSFKTWSGKLERQLSNIRGRSPRNSEQENNSSQEIEVLPVHRYFDALEGPELETLRDSEEIVLPEDKLWPFLLRFPVSSFGICLGVGSQAIMWKALATAPSTKFLHISPIVNVILWFISIALMVVVSSIYIFKVVLYFEAVRREYYHPIRVNFFFAPWISLLFLVQGTPPSVAKNLPPVLWYILMAPILCLELKIYGQWMSGGQRRLSKVANPSNHLSIVGNFVGALVGASMGLREGPLFFFAVGLAHYTVLFVTLYQRLPTNETLPKELHPVFFLFVAAPSVASMAWANIQGSFDNGSRIAHFISLFLYFSLAVRINFFRGFKFSLAWWAYTFPMTSAAIATMRYSSQVTNAFTQALSVMLSGVSTLIVTTLLITTILHAFVLRDLFPNDIAIAISDRKPMPHKHWFQNFHMRHGSSDASDIENYLKFITTDN